MAKSRSSASKLMDPYSRAIVHLRAQRKRQRLGLIFGSGVSKDLSFPDWAELIERVAAHPKVNAAALLARLEAENKGPSRTQAAQTHIIYEHYRSNRIAELDIAEPTSLLTQRRIKSDWLEIIHGQLYADQGTDAAVKEARIRNHPYLPAFRDIIKESPLTVNYNFDDSLETLLMVTRTEKELEVSRGYETTDKPNAQFQNNEGVIYHPNGFIPANFGDGASSEVVFATEAFQDQLISAAHGRYLHLSNHLFRNTCLLVGLSLDDTTLQSLLRQNAVKNPGHIHYVVHYVASEEDLSSESREVIFNANFTAYNLYTLFLNAAGIRELAELISATDEKFARENAGKALKYVYYLIGSIGAGKSTAAANLRNLTTYDEWIDPRLPQLAKPQAEVDEGFHEEIDAWIAEQFHKKNFALNRCHEGVHLVDRSPLDPLTFPGDRANKANNLLGVITNEGAIPVEKGHIILLDCDLEDIQLRNGLKHKFWKDDEVKDLLQGISEVYGDVEKTRICTRGRKAEDVAKAIAGVIFRGDYKPVDVQAELQKYADAA